MKRMDGEGKSNGGWRFVVGDGHWTELDGGGMTLPVFAGGEHSKRKVLDNEGELEIGGVGQQICLWFQNQKCTDEPLVQ